MKPAMWDKDIRSFGAKNIRIGTEEEYAEIRFRVKSIIWFRNEFHHTDFTDWHYLRVGKPTVSAGLKPPKGISAYLKNLATRYKHIINVS